MSEFRKLVGKISNNSGSNQISVDDQEVLNNYLHRGNGHAILDKSLFSSRLSVIPLGKHCYDNEILFKSTRNHFHFKCAR